MTVNSTVYQNITASTSWVDSIHVCVKAGENRFDLLLLSCLFFKGIEKIEIHRLKKRKKTQFAKIKRQQNNKRKKKSTCKLTYNQIQDIKDKTKKKKRRKLETKINIFLHIEIRHN